MPVHEYKVIPAPRRGDKARGAKTTAERFAAALSQVMNDLGREGWEYLRADTLPCEERVGLTGKATAFQNMLVFRRLVDHAPRQPETSGVTASAPAVGSAVGSEGAAPRIVSAPQDMAAPAIGPARDEDALSG